MTDRCVCAQCGTEVAASLLACPSCKALIHAERLKRLAAQAGEAEKADDPRAALEHWRAALELLPPATRQFDAIRQKVEDLVPRTSGLPRAPKAAGGAPARNTGWLRTAATAVGVALLFAITKGKLLLLGLTKWGTLVSMLLSMGVYWTAWGWKFALGLVISIYVHEMGHVVALRRCGVAASAPMFIPGLGAVIRLRQRVASPREDALVGLAGPIWGLATAIAAYAVFLAFDWPSWAAIARVGAWINLFNLLPIWQLDGGRGFNALNRNQRWLAVLVILGAWSWAEEGLLLLLFLCACGRSLVGKPPERPDWSAFLKFAFLVVALTAMTLIEVRVPK